MSLRLHEIAEAGHRILDPFTAAKIALVGDVARLHTEQRVLDLCCGKGEWLCTWSRDHGVRGTGVDISAVFLPAARARALELGVAERLTFVSADAAAWAGEGPAYDVVCCIGATWIGGGIGGTIDLLRRHARPDGLLLIGEPYWIDPPAPAAEDAIGHGFTSLAGTVRRCAERGADLVELVLAADDDWDRYVAAQWWTVTEWLRGHPEDPDHAAMGSFLAASRSNHLEYGRGHLGWGVFVLRLR